ncbi:hypothetical protein [Thiocystis violacea]|uniref:hypothetical protein n=1 Tax=Thiocystis violacea TaxID=13725 RepID=UPI001903B0DC|nr:hypothetical protein [Thiocystis violacea]
MNTHETARLVGIVAVMLAIPFSCLLAQALLCWMERRAEERPIFYVPIRAW